MKKKKTWLMILSFVLLVYAVIALVSTPGYFKDSVAGGFVCLLSSILLGGLGYLSFRKARSLKVTEATAPAPYPVRRTAQESFIVKQQAAFNEELLAIPRVPVTVSDKKPKKGAIVLEMPEIHMTNITKRTNINGIFPFVVIDVETSGLSPRYHDIIEVSAIRYEAGFTPVSCFTTLLKPKHPIQESAIEVHHITDDMVADKPYFSQVSDSLSEYISGCNIVGHNLKFDLGFLFAGGAKLPANVKYFDTLYLAKHTISSETGQQWDNDIKAYVDMEDWEIENYKLPTLCEYYGIYRSDAHRSASDCLATAKVFEHLIEDKMAKSTE